MADKGGDRIMELKNRSQYLDKLISVQDMEVIKVVTGIRRCGKSSLLKLMMAHLREQGVMEEQILSMNFESMQFADMDSKSLYQYVTERESKGKRLYLFLDEVQKVRDWQDAVNSFRVDLDCDIYVTGSNAYLLSSELSTYLSGRYVEIKMLPLSFREFLDFHGYLLEEYKAPNGTMKQRAKGKDGEAYELRDLFEAYAQFGGMPALAEAELDQERANMLLDGIYSAVVVRDILERGKRKEQRAVTDALLLRKIILFLADNIGNNTSAASIGRTLVSEGLLDDGRKAKPAVQTISAYIDALLESYIFYEVKRFDIKGKGYLRTLGKYYIVDPGLRTYLLGNRGGDVGHILENIVYFELLRRGYEVAIGKVGEKEIDFIATKMNEKKYIQVTDNMNAPETRARELAPLQAVQDNYEKIVIAIPSILTQGRMAENSIPSRIVLTWPKISIASQIGCCLTRHLPNGPWRIGALRQPTTRTWSTQSYLRLALGWQEVSMILVTRAGTVSSFSSTMAIPSLGWIPPRTNKSSTLTQEQVVKICSFYCAFWKGERHEVN